MEKLTAFRVIHTSATDQDRTGSKCVRVKVVTSSRIVKNDAAVNFPHSKGSPSIAVTQTGRAQRKRLRDFGPISVAFKIRYPDRYQAGHLRTVQRRMKIWRQEAEQRLIIDMGGLTEDVSCDSGRVPGK